MTAVTDLQQATTVLNDKLNTALQGDYINPVDFGARSGEYCDVAFTQAIAAALRPIGAPSSEKRYAYKPIIVPPGNYLFQRPLRIWSVQNLTFIGLMSGIGTNYAEKAFPTLLEFKGGMEAGFDLNGCTHCTFANFTVIGARGIDGEDDCPNRLIWLRNSSNSDPLSTTTRNQFYNVRSSGHFRESGFRIGHPNGSLQEDLTFLYGVEVSGEWETGEETKWQSGFYFGTHVMGNNLNHSAYGINSRGCKNNIVVDASNVAMYGGTIQNAECDIDIRGIHGYFYCSGVRTENSQQFLRAHVPTSVVQQAIIENCEIRLNKVKALFEAEPDYQRDLPKRNTSIDDDLVIRLSQRWVELFSKHGIISKSGRPSVKWVGKNYWRITWNATLTYSVVRENDTLYVSDSSWVSWSVNGMLRLANIRVMRDAPGIVPMVRLGSNSHAFLLAEGVAIRHPLINQNTLVEAGGHSARAILIHCYGMDENANVATPIPFHMIGMSRGAMLPDYIKTHGLAVSPLADPSSPLVRLYTTEGNTTHTYYLVAKDSMGRRTLPSAPVTITNGPRTVDKDNRILISANGPFDAVTFDVLKGDPSNVLARDVPVGTLMHNDSLGFFDFGQPTEEYIPPSYNETGILWHQGLQAGFFGTQPVSKPVVTGSWSDASASKSLVAALAALGLVDDQTTL